MSANAYTQRCKVSWEALSQAVAGFVVVRCDGYGCTCLHWTSDSRDDRIGCGDNERFIGDVIGRQFVDDACDARIVWRGISRCGQSATNVRIQVCLHQKAEATRRGEGSCKGIPYQRSGVFSSRVSAYGYITRYGNRGLRIRLYEVGGVKGQFVCLALNG